MQRHLVKVRVRLQARVRLRIGLRIRLRARLGLRLGAQVSVQRHHRRQRHAAAADDQPTFSVPADAASRPRCEAVAPAARRALLAELTRPVRLLRDPSVVRSAHVAEDRLVGGLGGRSGDLTRRHRFFDHGGLVLALEIEAALGPHGAGVRWSVPTPRPQSCGSEGRRPTRRKLEGG
eukprot:scaffold53994_cov30-Phaeocystis_antarctica.AAC.1